MKVEKNKTETATIELSIDDLKEYFSSRLNTFDLDDYTITGLYDKTKKHITYSGVPGDEYVDDIFDGITIQLEKNN